MRSLRAIIVSATGLTVVVTGSAALAGTNTRTLAPGVTLTSKAYGRPVAKPWTVGVRQPGHSRIATLQEADKLVANLRARRLTGVTEAVRTPPVPGMPPARTLGYTVRTGLFRTRGEARRLARKLVKPARGATALGATVLAITDEGGPVSGPWRIKIVRADPKRVRLGVTAGRSVAATETVSSMSPRAIAAVNGGFFRIGTAAPGEPVGVLVQDGRLLGGDRGRRSALLLQNGRGRVTELRTILRIRPADNAAPHYLAVNTRPGPDGMAVFTPEYGGELPRVDGNEAEFDAATGAVVTARHRAASEPARTVAPGRLVVQARGDSADWLAAHAGQASRATIDSTLTDQRRHRTVPLAAGTFAVGGNVTLVRAGRIYISALDAGTSSRRDSYHGMVLRRAPRTLAGIDRHGRLLLVTVDGRQPGYSVGMTLPEAAALMRDLGAVDALNLDGGGSTTMVTGGDLINRPSDPGGRQRRVGSAVVVTPR